ncbi:hypothetical protein L6Q21_09175 [Sandaracinobacter sp. RS1-74]|uniref:hypothetical protein n=1 Tax=Sandaracinobacteroides sayramensis TaxID=2913411 RepID=UPI001EDB08C0|nr:hypothetical protein [Sandaracinobacteroides sayramensis]MCG2841150.1 hypothetical protein [Sandaracinobacteroides sayramensis]
MVDDSTSEMEAGSRAARLRGWKEIGRRFGVDERTAKRWETTRGLPVHRVPGEPRAPVFAYEHELKAWVEQDKGEAPPAVAGKQAPPPPARRPWLAVALLLLALTAAVALWMGWRAAEEGRAAEARLGDLTRLAASQVAAVNDQLDSQPGTVAVRAALAQEAVQVLGRVAASPDASPGLKQEAAEGYRRLAVLQNAIDRPSLRDRAAATRSLAQAQRLLEGDKGAEAAQVRARVQIEMARQAAGGGDPKAAMAMLSAAEPVARRAGGAVLDDWWLAKSAAASWNGDYEESANAAREVSLSSIGDPAEALTRLRALDLEAEASFYLEKPAAARATYLRAVDSAEAALARWPDDNRLRWNLLRQQWNVGSTLIGEGRPREAVPVLAEALAGWQAVQRSDPSDEAVRAWVLATRLSYGQALAAAGAYPRAIAVLSEVVAERKAWHAGRPEDADRRRLLMNGVASLADALGASGRAGEACALYGEADRIGADMEKDGQLTGFDRRETLRMVAAARARHCG